MRNFKLFRRSGNYILFIVISIIAVIAFSCNNQSNTGKINLEELVKRHNVTMKTLDDLGALSVGNGRFCYTTNITGMQSYPEYYTKDGIPLTTMPEWEWHSFPNTDSCKLYDTYMWLDVQNRKVP